jgi:threonine dehydratase
MGIPSIPRKRGGILPLSWRFRPRWFVEFSSMFTIDELDHACEIVHRTLPATPQIRWPLLCERVGADVWVKHENHTPTGAFKIRGALFYFSELLRKNPETKGVIAATRGNFGQSVAFAGSRAGLRTVIVVPHGNSREQNAAMRGLGAELIEFGHDFQDAPDSEIMEGHEDLLQRNPQSSGGRRGSAPGRATARTGYRP